MIKSTVKLIIIAVLFINLSSCGNTSKSEKKENPKTNLPDTTKASKAEVKVQEPKEEKVVSLDGKYFNSQNSVLTISNSNKSSFKFSYVLKGQCDGISDEGLATFDGENIAVRYGEDGTEIEYFKINKNGSIDFELGLDIDYIGMDCAKFFDGHFEKK